MAEELDIDEELTEKDGEEKKKSKAPVMVIAIIIIIAGLFTGFYWFLVSSQYLKTDNAKVAADVYPITSKVEGKVLKFNAYVGKYVESGEILGRVDGGPYIKSPSNGKFIEVDAERGDYVLTTDVMGYVANTYDMYIGANIEETDITKIKEGQSVKVTLDAYGSQKFEGVVKQVNSITNNALTGQTTSFSTSGTYTKTTQLIPIKIKLVNSDIPLENIIGTNATVNIKVK